MLEKGRQTKEEFRALHGRKRVQYIWDYYKLPLAIACLIVLAAIYFIHRHLTDKDIVLYMAMVNVSIGENLEGELTDGFLEEASIDTAKNRFYLYKGLCLTEDSNNAQREYTYASQMKILGAVDSGQLDIVLVNQEAFDAFAQNGYLCNMETLLSEDTALYEEWKGDLVRNTVILEDASSGQDAGTEEYPMGLELSKTRLFEAARLNGAVYLAVIKNSPRKNTVLSYLHYLWAAAA